ncbi:MAG TPA: hypothetical protein VIF09_05815 [Polyangiaceae bacterium]|jgi:hypothetical protein
MSSRTSLSLAAAVVAACAASWAGCSSSSGGGGGSSDAGDGSSSGGSSGGSSSGGGSGGGSGSSSGGGSGSSSGSDGGGTATCPTVPCTGGQVCCADLVKDVPYCAATCPPEDTIACIGPGTCGGSTPDCCATDVLDGMDAGQGFPHCTTASLTTKCVPQCVSNIQISCTATQTLHVCQAAGDCAGDTANPNCCLVAGYHVCVSTILKNLGALSCL